MKRLPWLVLIAAACDSGSTQMMVNNNPDLTMSAPDLSMKPGDMALQPGADMTMVYVDLATVSTGGIPDPGATHMVDSNFGDVEPNDAPATATPLGVSQQAMMYFWVNNNSGGGTDTSEFYVFKTGATAGTFSLGFSGICWSGAITGIDATLWKVSAGQQVMPAVQTWPSTASCTPPTVSPAVEANTEYLLGLDIHGGAGTYFA
jgi:hypothetical protein